MRLNKTLQWASFPSISHFSLKDLCLTFCTSLILQNNIRFKQKYTKHDFILQKHVSCVIVICVAVCVVCVVSMERDHLVKWWNTSQQKVIQHLDSFAHRHHSTCCKIRGHVEEDWELRLPHDWQMDIRIGRSASVLYKHGESSMRPDTALWKTLF